MEFQSFNIYLGLAIVGMFSGFGTAIGNYFFNEVLKPRVERHILKRKKKK